jgi:hypothetical protein
MRKCKLTPCRIGMFIDEVRSELSLYGDVSDKHDHIDELIRHGRLSAYSFGAGQYILYDAERQRALVSLAKWPAPPAWVDATEPIRSIDNYIEFSTDENALGYECEGFTVHRRGHQAGARALFEQLARARHGENAVARHLQYLGYEDDGSRGYSFAYQVFIGENLMNGQMKGFFSYFHVRLKPVKEAEAAAA